MYNDQLQFGRGKGKGPQAVPEVIQYMFYLYLLYIYFCKQMCNLLKGLGV